MISLLGIALLAVGFASAYRLFSARPGVPPSGWFPDFGAHRRRLWDSRAWTSEVRPGDVAANRGRFFRGLFWGPWFWILLGSVGVLIAGSFLYDASGSVNVMALTSFLAMAGICWAFYRFVARQLALDDVISLSEVAAVAVATAGATLVFAANINSVIIAATSVRFGTLTVGLVEEGTKLLVPLALYLVGRYRDPRAGIAIGIAAGFGFAIAETTQYAYATANASGPDLCGEVVGTPTASEVISAQVFRMFTVSPLHWMWTGFATAIAWRMWHLYGRRGTPAALTAIVFVMVVHSANDFSATFGCGDAGESLGAQLVRWGILAGTYFAFKAAARTSTPPQLIGQVSRGWTPRRLRSG